MVKCVLPHIASSSKTGSNLSHALFTTTAPILYTTGIQSRCTTIDINLEGVRGGTSSNCGLYLQLVGYADDAMTLPRTTAVIKIYFDDTNDRYHFYIYGYEYYGTGTSASNFYLNSKIQHLFICWEFYIVEGAIGVKIAISAGNTFGLNQIREEGIQTTGWTGSAKKYEAFKFIVGAYAIDDPMSIVLGSPVLHPLKTSIGYQEHPLHRDFVTDENRDYDYNAPSSGTAWIKQLEHGMTITPSMVQGQMSNDVVFMSDQVGSTEDEQSTTGGVIAMLKAFIASNPAISFVNDILLMVQSFSSPTNFKIPHLGSGPLMIPHIRGWMTALVDDLKDNPDRVSDEQLNIMSNWVENKRVNKAKTTYLAMLSEYLEDQSE